MCQGRQGTRDFERIPEVTPVFVPLALTAPSHGTDFLWHSAPGCWTILLHWERELEYWNFSHPPLLAPSQHSKVSPAGWD